MMGHTTTLRHLLLASAAGIAVFPVAQNAQAQTFIANAATNAAATIFTLGNGQSAQVTATGSLGITVAASGNPTAPAISVTAAGGAAFVLNQGTISTVQTPGGQGVGVGLGAGLGTLTNALGALITLTSTNSGTGITSAIYNAGSVGTVANAGNILSTQDTLVGGSSSQLYSASGLRNDGTIGTLTNSGTISSDSTVSVVIPIVITNAITNTGTIGTLSNSGQLSASGTSNNAVSTSGTIGTLTNAATGTIAAALGGFNGGNIPAANGVNVEGNGNI